MSLSFSESQSLTKITDLLYSFLPGSSPWPGTYTFAEAANDSGVGDYWTGGSKRPALNELLRQCHEYRQQRFCPLIIKIVERGLVYRSGKGIPVTREEIQQLNELLLRVQFKIPELWAQDFIDSLPTSVSEESVATSNTQPVANATNMRAQQLSELGEEFIQLTQETDRQAAGLRLEKILNRLFTLFDMSPREAFRVVGEQIDGSFEFSGLTYLLEAKWTTKKVPESDLLVFKGKIEGKSPFTRGLFMSINGYSEDAIQAITTGKSIGFVMMDGAHLYRVLCGQIDLPDIIKACVRALDEAGKPYTPVYEMQ